MDLSKEYIVMCRAARELQEEWKPRRGDYHHEASHSQLIQSDHDYHKHVAEHTEILYDLVFWEKDLELDTWLPRQDQLQEMVVDEDFGCDKWDVLLDSFAVWRKEGEIEIGWLPEKQWLAFVMNQKYGKKWTGKEWIATLSPQPQ